MIRMKSKDLSVREIGEKYQISRTMLQRYEKAELIYPTSRNKYGHLYYDEKMVERILFIRYLQECDYILPEIEKIMNFSLPELKESLELKIQELNFKVKKIESHIEITKKIIKSMHKNNDANFIHIVDEIFKNDD